MLQSSAVSWLYSFCYRMASPEAVIDLTTTYSQDRNGLSEELRDLGQRIVVNERRTSPSPRINIAVGPRKCRGYYTINFKHD